MPEAETETVPNWLVRIISAQAAIGNANASNARTTTRLILIPSQIFLSFISLFHLGTLCSRYRSPLLLEHLWFQNYRTLLLVIYQQLNNIYRDCPKSRNAICCILATIRRPRSPRGSIPQAARPTTKRNNHGFGIGRGNLSTRKKNLGGPLPEPVQLFSNQSRGDPCYHKPEIWQVARSCHLIPQSWDVLLGAWSPYLWRVSSSGGGLFKRPVILWIRGAFYLW